MTDHVAGFEQLAMTGVIDVIAVQEGRGAGKGCYYWENQIDMPVAEVDPGLARILQYMDPSITDKVTFRRQFTASNNMVRNVIIKLF